MKLHPLGQHLRKQILKDHTTGISHLQITMHAHHSFTLFVFFFHSRGMTFKDITLQTSFS